MPTHGQLSVLGVLLVTAYASACSSTVQPKSSPEPTLSVTNPRCTVDGCRTVQVRAFVWAWPIPQSAIGVKLVGEVTGKQACLALGPSWTQTVLQVDSTGTATDSTTYSWTPDEPIYIVGIDWPTSQADGANALGILDLTQTFTPADAPG